MAELPELRTIANRNGGSTTMLLSRQRSNSPEGVFVLGSGAFREGAGPQRAGISGTSRISNDRDAESRKQSRESGFDFAVSRKASWASLDSGDRRVFNHWVLAVAAFYSSLVVLLLVAMLLSVHKTEGGSSELPPAARGIDR
jgi:hypothetical protein